MLAKRRPKTTTNRVHYNPSQQTASHIDIAVNDTNEFIKRYSRQRQQQQQQQHTFNRHSTDGTTVIYTHPSTLAMLTLNKRASDTISDAAAAAVVVANDNILVGSNQLLTTRQRHQRDLFSGDLGIPPIPPPPPPLPLPAATLRQNHVGNVVQTFETLALQRQLATFNQRQQQLTKIRKQQPNAFSKYIKFPIFKSKQLQQSTHQEEAVYNNNTSFNERNKQIAQQQIQQMDIDYRKNLFTTHTLTQSQNINNNNNNNSNNNDEAGVVAVFDEMLAGYSATEDDYDDAALIPKDNHNNNRNNEDNNDNEMLMLKNSSHLSIININGNEAEDNVLHINLRTTTTTGKSETNATTNSQRVLPIMHKKTTTAPPAPPPKPVKSLTKTMATQTLKRKSLCKTAAANDASYDDKESVNVDNEVTNTNDFMRGSTLSQSFVHQANWQRHKKAKAPKPPILPITTTPNARTQLLTNPLWEKFRLNMKRTHSFNLLK